MGKRKPIRTCKDCIHEYACQQWNIGTIHEMDSTNCINYETVRESVAFFIGYQEGRCEK
jgi:hypothetical protein